MVVAVFYQTRRCKWCFLSGQTGLLFYFYFVGKNGFYKEPDKNPTVKLWHVFVCFTLNPKHEVGPLGLKVWKLRKLRAATNANGDLRVVTQIVLMTYLNHKIIVPFLRAYSHLAELNCTRVRLTPEVRFAQCRARARLKEVGQSTATVGLGHRTHQFIRVKKITSASARPPNLEICSHKQSRLLRHRSVNITQ